MRSATESKERDTLRRFRCDQKQTRDKADNDNAKRSERERSTSFAAL